MRRYWMGIQPTSLPERSQTFSEYVLSLNKLVAFGSQHAHPQNSELTVTISILLIVSTTLTTNSMSTIDWFWRCVACEVKWKCVSQLTVTVLTCAGLLDFVHTFGCLLFSFTWSQKFHLCRMTWEVLQQLFSCIKLCEVCLAIQASTFHLQGFMQDTCLHVCIFPRQASLCASLFLCKTLFSVFVLHELVDWSLHEDQSKVTTIHTHLTLIFAWHPGLPVIHRMSWSERGNCHGTSQNHISTGGKSYILVCSVPVSLIVPKKLNCDQSYLLGIPLWSTGFNFFKPTDFFTGEHAQNALHFNNTRSVFLSGWKWKEKRWKSDGEVMVKWRPLAGKQAVERLCPLALALFVWRDGRDLRPILCFCHPETPCQLLLKPHLQTPRPPCHPPLKPPPPPPPPPPHPTLM